MKIVNVTIVITENNEIKRVAYDTQSGKMEVVGNLYHGEHRICSEVCQRVKEYVRSQNRIGAKHQKESSNAD